MVQQIEAAERARFEDVLRQQPIEADTESVLEDAAKVGRQASGSAIGCAVQGEE